MKNHILSSLLLLLLALLLPFAFPLELKVQVVGWQQLKSEYGHLLLLEPGKRFEASLFKNRKGADGPKDGDGKGRQPLGHYDIGTFQLPEEWVNEMEVDQQNGNYLRKNVYTLDIFIPSGKNYLKKPLNFYLTEPTKNFVRITLMGHDKTDVVEVLSMDKFPVRHLLFQMLSVTVNDGSNKSAALLLKHIQCPKAEWSIGDNLPGQKILLARGKRVCEDDTYLVHTALHYTNDDGLLGQMELPDSNSPRQLSCGEAVHDPDINVYDISVGTNGLLQCRILITPMTEQATKLILRSSQENVLDLWPKVTKMLAQINGAKRSAEIAMENHQPSQQQQSDQLEAKRQKSTFYHPQQQQQNAFQGLSNPFYTNPRSNDGTAVLSFGQPQHWQPHSQQPPQQLKLKQPFTADVPTAPFPTFVQQPSQQQQHLPQSQLDQKQPLPTQMPLPIEQWLSAAWHQLGPPAGGNQNPPHTIHELDAFFGLWEKRKSEALMRHVERRQRQLQRNQQPATSSSRHQQQQQQMTAGNIFAHQQQQPRAGHEANSVLASANVIPFSDDDDSEDSALKNFDFSDYIL